eukprot:scaffold10056_cov69-Phaeocystis_antarctica.AAC.3
MYVINRSVLRVLLTLLCGYSGNARGGENAMRKTIRRKFRKELSAQRPSAKLARQDGARWTGFVPII